MNSYEEKQANRKARFEELSAKAKDESIRTYARASGMSHSIPFGQPILIGHHSEQRDRNFRNSIHETYGKAFALQDKASHYADKASSVGMGGISSDDPDAIQKLRAELAHVEASQERMKAGNKALRTHKALEDQTAALLALGFTHEQAAEAIKPDSCGRVGFPPFTLRNNNANARRIAGRIAELEKRGQRENVEKEGNGYTYREDTKENRVMFVFPGKPDEATRAVLKRAAFKWSPSRGAWVRQLSPAGLLAAASVRCMLDKKSN